MIKVLCFGTFDGVHDGHKAMLKQAKRLGNYLVAAVAPDAVVQELKGCIPKDTSARRISMLKDEHLADEVILADVEINSWSILKRTKPNIIALGYDQQELRSSLEEYLEKSYPEMETEEGWQTNPKKPKIVMLSPHKPKSLHNSKLRNNQ